MYLFSVLCILVCFNVASSIDLPECKKIECADYKVIAKKTNYEVRQYDQLKVASTQSKTKASLFITLYRFIRGNNDRKEKIPMTAPVLKYYNVDSKANEPEKSEHKMSFFMTKSIGDNVPEPTNKKVTIDNFGPVTVYAVRFGGYMWRSEIIRHQKKLYNALKADGVDFDESVVVTAGYNSPYQLWNRHNDLFYMAKDTNSAQSLM